jgi:hypothetical protein
MNNDYSKVDYWVVQDPIPSSLIFLLKHGIRPSKVVLVLTEQPVANPRGWKYLPIYKHFFPKILTWDTELLKKGKPFIPYKVPVGFDPKDYPQYRASKKKGLSLMIHSNQTSNTKGELYTLRRKIIKYFEKRGDNLLDLYGHRWNTDKSHSPFFTNIYKGLASDKNNTFSEYYFSFCIENSVNPGMYEYDIFISMATGTVPIFMPPPDFENTLPKDTFINFNDYPNWDDLVKKMQSLINTSEYEAYLERGWKFINSEKYKPFSIEQFCEDIYNTIPNHE